MANWTPAQDAELAKIWADQTISTAEGARRIGVTKNAYVGRAHRLALPGKESPVKRAKLTGSVWRLPEPPKPKPPRLGTGPTLQALASVPAEMQKPAPEPVRLKRLVGKSEPCCYPIGEPRTAAFRYCDVPSLRGRAYCPEHAEIAYARVRDRREASA